MKHQKISSDSKITNQIQQKDFYLEYLKRNRIINEKNLNKNFLSIAEKKKYGEIITQRIFPSKYVNLLIDEPEDFFNEIDLIVDDIKKNNLMIIDENDVLLFEYYIYKCLTSNNSNKNTKNIYIKNFEKFFKKFSFKINEVNKGLQNILNILSYKINLRDIIFYDLCEKFIELNIIDENTILNKDAKEINCLDNIYNLYKQINLNYLDKNYCDQINFEYENNKKININDYNNLVIKNMSDSLKKKETVIEKQKENYEKFFNLVNLISKKFPIILEKYGLEINQMLFIHFFNEYDFKPSSYNSG